jgi:hypothetical protein
VQVGQSAEEQGVEDLVDPDAVSLVETHHHLQMNQTKLSITNAMPAATALITSLIAISITPPLPHYAISSLRFVSRPQSHGETPSATQSHQA